MTENNKPIIIDGVDVSKCEHNYNKKSGEYSACNLYPPPLNCKRHPNCLFKQLACKEQECEELQYQLKCVTGREKGHKANSDFWEKHCEKLEEQLDQLKQTLPEIKEIAEICSFTDSSELLLKRIKLILQKINEVQNENK